MNEGISIVIPTYNEEKVIERTLRHLADCKRTYNLELIVSDDCSTDGTVAIARRLADAVVLNETGKRARSGALNRGARRASHDTMIFMDADILIEDRDEFFREVHERFSRRADVAGGMIDFFVYPEEESFWDRVTHVFWNGVMRLTLAATGIGISTPGFQMGKRDAFEQIGGYDEDLRLIQDVDYSLRLSKARRFHYFGRSRILESPRRYRDEGYTVYAYRSTLRWLFILFRHRSYGRYKLVR
jgi:glycosyltransferase involved in cell wall biosynthesis